MVLAPRPGRDARPAVGRLHAETRWLLASWRRLCCDVLVTRATAWLAVVVAMAVAWRSNAQQAGSQDLATVAGSEVRPSLPGWFSGTSGAGWFLGEKYM